MRNGTNDSALRPGLVLAVLALGALAYSVLQSIVAPALPLLAQRLGTSTTDATWILTAFLLSASVFTPVLGRLGDLHGKHRLLRITFLLLTVGTLVSALATSLPLMLAGRVLQGAGGAIFPLSFAIVRDVFPRERVAPGIGLLSAMLGVGGAIGIIGAGVIVEYLSYHWLYWVPFVVCVVATVAVWRLVPASPASTHTGGVNWTSALLLSAGLVTLLLGVTQAERWGWGSARNLGAIAAGLALVAAYIGAELRARTPLADMRLMAQRGVWTTNAVTFLVGFAMFAGIVLIPALLEMPKASGYGFGDSVLTTGLYLVPNALAMIVAGAFAARLSHAHGAKVPAVLGTAITGVAYLMLALAHDTPAQIVAGVAVQGVGIGLAFASLANLIIDEAPAEHTAAASAINTIMRTVGGAFGASIPAAILAAHLIPGTPLPTEHAFTVALLVPAGLMAVGVVLGTLVPQRAPHDAAVPSAA